MIRKVLDRSGLLVLAIGFVVFVSVNQWLFKSWRLDLTENQIYSVSDGTKNIINGLQQPIKLKLFFSESVMQDDPFFRNYAQRVEELLEEYVAINDQNLSLEVIDPEPFSEAEDLANSVGLQEMPGPAGDAWFLGLVIEGKNKQEVLPFFHPDKEKFLEYDISQAIYKAAQVNKPVIGLIAGLQVNGGFDFMARRQTPAWTVFEQLKQLYDIKTLTGDEEQFEGIDLLMLVQPSSLSDQARYAIDQFVLSGGKTLLFYDPIADSSKSANPMMPGGDQGQVDDLSMLLTQWGVSVDLTKVVADKKHAYAVQTDRRSAPIPHLGLIGYGPENFDPNDVISAELEGVNWGSMGAIEAIEGATTQLHALVTSSADSGLIDAETMRTATDPKTMLSAYKADDKRYVVAARISGDAKTAFPNGIPQVKESDQTDGEEQSGESEQAEGDLNAASEAAEPEDADSTQGEHETSEYVLPEGHLAQSSRPIQVMLIADTDLLTDSMWVQVSNFFGQQLAQAFADNGSFVVNAIDNMVGSSDLIGLRSRGQYSRPFERVEAIRAAAGEQFLQKEAELQQQLTETETKLAELQSAKNEDGQLELSAEQKKALADFQGQKLQIRKDLRNVRHQLDKDIEALGSQVKVLNIIGMPIMLIVFAIVIGRSRRKLRAEMSR
jgi:ABC-type uncharacterized transport system involved in gliding motility auxiliary subunit